MLALYISAVVVAVERFINRKRLKVHEVLKDVGWLTLVFAFIEFAYLMFVEAATLNFGSAVRPFWYTEWWAFKDLLLSAAVAVLLILTSVWLEQAGITELRMWVPPRRPAVRLAARQSAEVDRCDVEW